MSQLISIKEVLDSPEFKAGKLKPIIKKLSDGREVLLGFEPKKRSRNYRKKLLLPRPFPLDELPNRKAAKRAEENAPSVDQNPTQPTSVPEAGE